MTSQGIVSHTHDVSRCMCVINLNAHETCIVKLTKKHLVYVHVYSAMAHPGDFFQERHVVEIAHASVLRAEVTARTSVPLHRFLLHLFTQRLKSVWW